MFKEMSRILGIQKGLTRIIVGFVLSGVFQAAAFIMLVPLLRHLFAQDWNGMWPWLGGVVAAGVLACIANISTTIFSYNLSTFDICGQSVERVGNKIFTLPLGWFDDRARGRISHALSYHVNNLSHYPSVALPAICNTLSMAGVMLLAGLVVNWQATLPFLLALPFCVWAFRHMLTDVDEEVNHHSDMERALTARSLEYAQAQPLLRAPHRKQWKPLEDAIDTDSQAILEELTATSNVAKVYQLPLILACVVSLLVLGWQLASGYHGLGVQPVDVALFLAIAVLIVRMFIPLMQVVLNVAAITISREALLGLASILDAPGLPEPDPNQRMRIPGVDVQLDDVSFGYREDTPVLRDVNLYMPARTMTALVGPSGGGKSTIQRLIARFWDVNKGAVRIGGIDVRDVSTEELMQNLSIVFQETYLFNGTILENVRVGRPDASDEDVKEAARAACLDTVIESLPEGWDAMVGEGGSRLSGGERQRVAIARALLKKSPIVLLDEITSSLDGENEAAIVETLHRLAHNTTVIVIAHRLSTIKAADQIAVVANGGVEALGTHEELLAAGGTYAQFWEDQEFSQRWKLVD